MGLVALDVVEEVGSFGEVWPYGGAFAQDQVPLEGVDCGFGSSQTFGEVVGCADRPQGSAVGTEEGQQRGSVRTGCQRSPKASLGIDQLKRRGPLFADDLGQTQPSDRDGEQDDHRPIHPQ